MFKTVSIAICTAVLAGPSAAQNDCLDMMMAILDEPKNGDVKSISVNAKDISEMEELIDFSVLEPAIVRGASPACRKGIVQTKLKQHFEGAKAVRAAINEDGDGWVPVVSEHIQEALAGVAWDVAYPDGLALTLTPYWDVEGSLVQIGFESVCGQFNVDLASSETVG